MPKKTKRGLTQRDQAIFFVMLSITVVFSLGVFVVGASYLDRGPAGFYETERQDVVDQIERFRERHGRYPKSPKEAGLVVDEALYCPEYEYEATDGEFHIELRRSRLFPPGERWWSYHSKRGTWIYGSESW